MGVVEDLVGRSNRLGADPRNTNYAGGNTSAKAQADDPVTGLPVELVWVKGSGGDLGTLTEAGLAVLRLDRLRALAQTYPGEAREDEMVAAFDYCLHGRGGAAPSIDTAMHGLVDAAHVDHLHPDSGIALATAADGEALTKECFGHRVLWVPWRRPGFQLGLDIAAVRQAHPEAIGVILGGHGITAWGATSAECEANSLEIIRSAQAFIEDRGGPEPFGPVRSGYEPLPARERRARAAVLAPVLRGLASTDRPQVGHFTDAGPVLDFLAGEKLEALAALGTSCPDHFLRTKVRPMVLDLPTTASAADVDRRLRELHAEYREEYAAYYRRHARPDSPPMRGADPAIVLVPGVGLFSFGGTKQTARVAAEFYLNAINVMRGAEAISTYSPIAESEKFRIEYWALEEAKLARLPKPKPLATRIAVVTGAGSGIGRAIAHRLAAEGACVVVSDRDGAAAARVAEEIGSADIAVPVTADVTDADGVAELFRSAALAFGGLDLVVNNAGLSISKPLVETTEADWDLQHSVMARGSFLVSREAARAMLAQGMGGDIVYISSKNSVFAGTNNVAYGAAKADQSHQVRLLAAELGEHGIRVNGVNPDGVVRGSGIFAGGWGAQRAAVYGVPEEELGAFYAQRTLLKREVLPEHIANAVFVLTAGELSHTTGLHIPVDAGVAAAFLRLMGRTASIAAVDLGASSGRVMVGSVTSDGLRLAEVQRFDNVPVRVLGTLRWDILRIHRAVVEGLRAAGRMVEHLDSVGVDSWGVDYGLLDRDGQLVANPVHYRDRRTEGVADRVLHELSPPRLYERTGLQHLPFNTLYQLVAAASTAELESAETLLLIPDLVSYWLTGVAGAEITNASTTQLLDASSHTWASDLMGQAGIRPSLFPALRRPGDPAGSLLPDVLAETGLRGPVAVTAVGSHDTASAVVGVPAANERFAYISCGTWSLVGVELDRPVLTEESRRANFTNEIGVDGTVRYLRNVMGLWLLQETLRTWQLAGIEADLEHLLVEAARLPAFGSVVDPDDPAFLAPGDMPHRIAAACRATDQRVPESPAAFVRCILDSLALAHRAAVRDAQRLTGRQIDVAHLVGGGSRNELLCQLTADALGVPVEAGPVEATALGNVLVQAGALGVVDGDRWAMRQLLRATQPTRRYLPAGNERSWDAAAQRLHPATQ